MTRRLKTPGDGETLSRLATHSFSVRGKERGAADPLSSQTPVIQMYATSDIAPEDRTRVVVHERVMGEEGEEDF